MQIKFQGFSLRMLTVCGSRPVPAAQQCRIRWEGEAHRLGGSLALPHQPTLGERKLLRPRALPCERLSLLSIMDAA